MREKTPKVIITFHTTADAIAFERFGKAHALPGRLIPVPRAITAGCGMAWCADPSRESVLREAVTQQGAAIQQFYTDILI